MENGTERAVVSRVNPDLGLPATSRPAYSFSGAGQLRADLLEIMLRGRELRVDRKGGLQRGCGFAQLSGANEGGGEIEVMQGLAGLQQRQLAVGGDGLGERLSIETFH